MPTKSCHSGLRPGTLRGSWCPSMPTPSKRPTRKVPTNTTESALSAGTRSVSVFLVNRRPPKSDERRDEAFAFQTQLAIHDDQSFVPRPDLRSLESTDWDERVAGLQYREAFEFAVG